MKILLLGEYSNVHATLARGLRALGHEVVVASGGDGWKNYPRDVDLLRHSLKKLPTARFFVHLLKEFRKFRGFDIVQLINPVFIDLRAERVKPFYDYLRRHNRHIVLGGFGMDYYYVKACLDFHTFRYSDFNFGEAERISTENEVFKRDWLYGPKGKLNQYIANDCDAIATGLYEYYVAYSKAFPACEKHTFIPFPIVLPETTFLPARKPGDPVRFFIGIQEKRSVYKGTDIMLRALERVAAEHPEACTVRKAVSVPFEQYVEMMNNCEVILDQLYSYTPAMNALEAMARGLITVGGAEPESYALLDEPELRPIINVEPNEESVYSVLTDLVVNRDVLIPKLQNICRAYIAKHHDHLVVARQYETLYSSLDS